MYGSHRQIGNEVSRLMYSLSEIIAYEKKLIYHSAPTENKETGFDSLKKKLKENMRKLQTHECTMQCDVNILSSTMNALSHTWSSIRLS